jgi:hypothetical protein
MTAAEKTATAVANARAKLAAGTGDYLDVALVELADVVDAAQRQAYYCDCCCEHCGDLETALDEAGR